MKIIIISHSVGYGGTLRLPTAHYDTMLMAGRSRGSRTDRIRLRSCKGRSSILSDPPINRRGPIRARQNGDAAVVVARDGFIVSFCRGGCRCWWSRGRSRVDIIIWTLNPFSRLLRLLLTFLLSREVIEPCNELLLETFPGYSDGPDT